MASYDQDSVLVQIGGVAGNSLEELKQAAKKGELTKTEISQIQQFLADNGFDPKGVDGRIGPNTFAALQEFIKLQDREGYYPGAGIAQKTGPAATPEVAPEVAPLTPAVTPAAAEVAPTIAGTAEAAVKLPFQVAGGVLTGVGQMTEEALGTAVELGRNLVGTATEGVTNVVDIIADAGNRAQQNPHVKQHDR